MDLTSSRTLVACVGNVLLGDDGFGVAVARRLVRRAWPSGVDIREFGIRGIDFVYALLDGYDTAILVDAVARGGPPGRLYVLEPEVPAASDAGPIGFDPHRLDPARVMAFVRAITDRLTLLRVVGCEPAQIPSDAEPTMGLSEAVQASVEPAVDLVASLVEHAMGGMARGTERSAHHA
jgi:hydrogenase maturation protease